MLILPGMVGTEQELVAKFNADVKSAISRSALEKATALNPSFSSVRCIG